MLKRLPEEIPWRLGLSATPIRNYDQMGSDALLSYFGQVIYEFGLDKAIGKYLTPYYYYPIPIELTDDEFEKYCELTRQLGKYAHSSEDEMTEIAKRIAIKVLAFKTTLSLSYFGLKRIFNLIKKLLTHYSM